MRLYKYLATPRVDVLETRRIRFTQPAAFNDPLEALPSYDPTRLLGELFPILEESEQELGQYLAAHPRPDLKERDVRSIFASILRRHRHMKSLKREAAMTLMSYLPAVVRSSYGNILQRSVGKGIGILSLSQTSTDILMWSHYAECHRGFVLGFDADSSLLSPSMRPPSEHVRKVVYALQRPSYVSRDNPEEYLRHIQDCLFTKSPAWAYEQEWRRIVMLDDQAHFPHDLVGDCHLFRLPPRAIREVIFGCRSEMSFRRRALQAIANWDDRREIEIMFAHIDPTLFAVRVDRSPWPEFVPFTDPVEAL